MTVALGGESQDSFATSDACCTTLVVCERLADLRRATEWCELVVAYAEQRSFIARAVLVPRGVRRTCSSAPATGSARRPCCSPRSRSTAARAAARTARSRSACSPSCACARGVRRRRRAGRGDGAAAPRAARAVELQLGRGELGHAAALLAAQDPGEDDCELLEARGTLALARGRSRPRARLRGPPLRGRRAVPSWMPPAGSLAAVPGRRGALEEAVDAFAALELPHDERAPSSRSPRRRPPPARRSRSPARPRRATRSRGSAPAATPTAPPRCCAASARAAAPSRAAGATRSPPARRRCWR